MRCGRIVGVGIALGTLATAVFVASGFAVAKDEKLEKAMNENFSELKQILVGLISSDYLVVSEHIDVIINHASELTQEVPDNAAMDRDRFLSHAYQLQSHATSLKSIAGVLIEHDKAAGSGALATDHLREAAAAHYGGMLTTCVTCHNSFRKRIMD